MSKQTYITASCIIREGVIHKDGQALFEANEPITEFLDSAYLHFAIDYPKFYKMDQLSKLGLVATEILLRDSFNPQLYHPDKIGIVLANASASLDTDIRYYKTVSSVASPALFVYTLPNIVIGEICIRNNFKGENAFFVFNQFDATFIARYVNNLFDINVLEACICGWIELLHEDYNTVLLLVERKPGSRALTCTATNINKIYRPGHG